MFRVPQVEVRIPGRNRWNVNHLIWSEGCVGGESEYDVEVPGAITRWQHWAVLPTSCFRCGGRLLFSAWRLSTPARSDGSPTWIYKLCMRFLGYRIFCYVIWKSITKQDVRMYFDLLHVMLPPERDIGFIITRKIPFFSKGGNRIYDLCRYSSIIKVNNNITSFITDIFPVCLMLPSVFRKDDAEKNNYNSESSQFRTHWMKFFIVPLKKRYLAACFSHEDFDEAINNMRYLLT